MGALQLWERGPAVQQVMGQALVKGAEPVPKLGEVLLDGIGKLLDDADLLADESPAVFGEKTEQPCLGGIVLQGGKAVAVMAE